MFKNWKKASIDNNKEWILVDESNSLEVIASITFSENSDGTYNVEAVSKKIGYTCRFDHVEKFRLKTVFRDLKRSVSIELFHLRAENIRPTARRKIYNMIDSTPMWMHLQNGAKKTKIKLIGNDYGKLAEILGKRVLDDILKEGGILDDMFPDIDVICTNRIRNVKKLERAGLGDIIVEVDYKKDGIYGKKMVIFEIKHGKIVIDQNQLRKYCSMRLNPGEYFKKADELKVIYMIFDDLDTLGASATYYLKEMDKDFARRILEQPPVENWGESISVEEREIYEQCRNY
jgi:hypothetical protein